MRYNIQRWHDEKDIPDKLNDCDRLEVVKQLIKAIDNAQNFEAILADLDPILEGIFQHQESCVDHIKIKLKNDGCMSAADIRVFLAENLPYYEAEDGDDFLYIVTAEDIERVSLKLYQHLTSRLSRLKKPSGSA